MSGKQERQFILAVAQKLGRKRVGMELGAHFDTVIVPRLKKVLGSGDGN